MTVPGVRKALATSVLQTPRIRILPRTRMSGEKCVFPQSIAKGAEPVHILTAAQPISVDSRTTELEREKACWFPGRRDAQMLQQQQQQQQTNKISQRDNLEQHQKTTYKWKLQ